MLAICRLSYRLRHFLHMQLMSQMSNRLSVVDEFEGALVALTARDPRV
jgi:hypothetical protein